MNSEDRIVIRKEKVEPKVDQFFEYIHFLKASDDLFSARMNKAITYAIYQEEHLRRFLIDGTYPFTMAMPSGLYTATLWEGPTGFSLIPSLVPK